VNYFAGHTWLRFNRDLSLGELCSSLFDLHDRAQTFLHDVFDSSRHSEAASADWLEIVSGLLSERGGVLRYDEQPLRIIT
jgi:hypothetical protein